MAEFDIDRFISKAGPVQLDDLDWDECARIGLTDAEARLLRYFADTESHTILYMRDLLAGYTARDPEVTSFLSVWVYEELWHGRAIDKLLRVAGREVPRDQYTKATVQASWRELVEEVLAKAAAYSTPRFVAAHMTWGAINELTAAAAYMSLASRTKNPVLATLCRRMAKQERKHYAFYYQQAEKRMKHDRYAQLVTRFVLWSFWTPVGSGVGHTDNMAFVGAQLFSEKDDWQVLVDAERTIQALPGMGWFKMLTTQVGEILKNYEREHGPASGWGRQPALRLAGEREQVVA